MAVNSKTCVREMFVEFSNLTRSDGCALFCQGNTVCQAAIFGPKAISSSRERVERTEIDLLFKRKCNNQHNVDNKVLGNWIKTTLEEVILTNIHPHSTVSITVQEVENDGSVLAAALNSTCCALLDAGIPMKCLIAAVSVTIDKDGSLILDSQHKENDSFQAILTFAFESLNCNIVSMTTQGWFNEEQFAKCAKLCKAGAKEIFDFYENTIKQRFRS